MNTLEGIIEDVRKGELVSNKEINMEKIAISPRWETIINKAVFLHQDLILYPNRKKGLPDNFENVVKFLFGEGVYVREDVTNGYPSFVIKGASFELNNARTVNADWITREVVE